jgi:hypothetical protein
MGTLKPPKGTASITTRIQNGKHHRWEVKTFYDKNGNWLGESSRVIGPSTPDGGR